MKKYKNVGCGGSLDIIIHNSRCDSELKSGRHQTNLFLKLSVLSINVESELQIQFLESKTFLAKKPHTFQVWSRLQLDPKNSNIHVLDSKYSICTVPVMNVVSFELTKNCQFVTSYSSLAAQK